MGRLSAVFLALLAFCLLSFAQARAAERLTVFAAASLTDALRDVDGLYSKQSGESVVESFASSSTLARQIEAGAPAQVFISADTQWMDYLARKSLIAVQAPLLGNELALIAPAESKVGPRAIDDKLDWLGLLGTDGRLAVGDPDHVPAGIYAKQALQTLGAWTQLESRLARAEDVRGALVLVERGDAPLGIVYVTDGRASAKVKTVGVFPAQGHVPIVYPAAILHGADTPPVKEYYKFLRGEAARAVFLRYGFAQP